MSNKDLLVSLQEELRNIKRAFSNSSLSKGSTPPPFPICVTVDVAAPPDAAAYDVQSLRLVLSFVSCNHEASPPWEVDVACTSPDVPDVLQRAIATHLRTVWLDTAFHAGHLLGVLQAAQQQFAQLLSLVPECKEAYTSVDEHGATTRRYATVYPESTLLVDDLSTQRSSNPEQPSSMHQPSITHGPATNTPLDGELRWYRRRCGAALSVTITSTSVTLECPVQPTDPEWQGGAVRLGLQVDVAAYDSQQAGAVVVQLTLIEDHASVMVQEDAAQGVMDMLLMQAPTVATRGLMPSSLGPLVLMYKHVEGYATELTTPRIDNGHDDDAGALSHTGTALPQHPIQVQLNDLRLDNVAAVEPLSVRLQVTCTRCHTRRDVDAGDDVMQCSTCAATMVLQYTPQLLHAHNNVIGTVRCEGCAPVDMLPSTLGVQCEQCDAGGALRNVQVGAMASRECRKCHATMTVWIAGVEFVVRPVQARQQASKQATHQATHRATGQAITSGTPLPDTGACRHYRHSHRWLRFPCCGKLHACDLCHEEASEDGHDAKWATRMVCGFCSREQAVASQCAHCGKRLATSAAAPSGRKTRFWEGGQGCRNPALLDSRDRHKYRNSRHKTVSRKKHSDK